MVYFEDMGTTLDISMEELDSFMESEEHASAHADDVRNFEVVENSGPTLTLTFERKIDGVWKRAGTRVTSFPPYCRFIEEIEGEYAGSRFVVAHRPDGKRTRIDVFGDVEGPTKSQEQLRTVWLGVLSRTQDEDVAALRKFRSRT